MSSRSSPRAATSVATSVETLPLSNCGERALARVLRHVAVHRDRPDVLPAELLHELVGSALRPHEDEREPVRRADVLDERLDLAVLRSPRRRSARSHWAAGWHARPRSGPGCWCKRVPARRQGRRAWRKRTSSGGCAAAGARCGRPEAGSPCRASGRPRRGRTCERARDRRAGGSPGLEPSGRGHEDVSPLGALGLGIQRHAAVDRGHGQLLGRGKRLKLGGDLRRELARRNEHEGGRPGVGRHRSLDDRHGESEGLAGPGRRLCEHVDARECVRKDESLDRERLVDRAS